MESQSTGLSKSTQAAGVAFALLAVVVLIGPLMTTDKDPTPSLLSTSADPTNSIPIESLNDPRTEKPSRAISQLPSIHQPVRERPLLPAMAEKSPRKLLNQNKQPIAALPMDVAKEQPTRRLVARHKRLMETRTDADLREDLRATASKVDMLNPEFRTANNYQSIREEVELAKTRYRGGLQRQAQLFAQQTRQKALLNARRGRPRRGRFEADVPVTTPADIQELSVHFDPLEQWLPHRADLDGLPLVMGDECRTSLPIAESLNKRSREIRNALPRPNTSVVTQIGSLTLNSAGYARIQALLAQTNWTANDIPALVQMLQAEPKKVRMSLVGVLASMGGPEATKALASRAVFDTHADVRKAAVNSLRLMDPAEFRPTLLSGFRYPWAPAADHAADALVELDDTNSVPDLRELLNKPDPVAPFQAEDGKWMAHELVGINHMRNCSLCHAPSLSTQDLARGLAPEPGKRLPTAVYYSGSDGYFVRADVTYLRQDFSVTQHEPEAKPWPTQQRFDYLVRKRELSDEEAQQAVAQAERRSRSNVSYPQREAVLYALYMLGDKHDEKLAATENRHRRF